MRRSLLAFLVVGVIAQVALAQQAPPFPPGALETEARLMTRVGPATRTWIRQEAARRVSAGDTSEAAVQRSVLAYRNLGGLADGDITAIVFLVMMEAAKSAQEDLKAIMDGVKKVNAAKQDARQQQAAVKSGTARIADTRAATPTPPLVARQAQAVPATMSSAELDRRLASARGNRDALNELGELHSLRMQMAMDRQSKIMSTLSNILKKMSDTSATITQNLK
jgi:hypothetical protein